VLHDEADNTVGMVDAFEDRLLICAVTVPDDWKPVFGADEFRAGQQAGNEAIKLIEQHHFLAKGEQFLIKLLEAMRQTGHGRSNSMAVS
jgi:hypothetical protein